MRDVFVGLPFPLSEKMPLLTKLTLQRFFYFFFFPKRRFPAVLQTGTVSTRQRQKITSLSFLTLWKAVDFGKKF